MNNENKKKIDLKSGIAVLFFVICVGLMMFSLFIGKFPIVEGISMEPNYHDGDVVYMTNLRDDTVINRGDVVVVKSPDNLLIIKRVIGLPGETVSSSENGDVLVNGKAVDRSYSAGELEQSFKPITCGEDEYFVMGDNTNHSTDSRFYGAFDRTKILGIVKNKIISK